MSGLNSFFAFRFFFAIVFLVLSVLAAMVAFVVFIWNELAMEASYRTKLGAGWQDEFEKYHGSVANAHARMVIAGIGVVVVPLIVFWLYKVLRSGTQTSQPGRRTQRKHKQQPHESRIARVVRYRRNAIVGNFFGVIGILAGVMLVIFQFGIFEKHEHEVFLGIAVFVAGYCGVVNGCWYWLKAKSWTEAVVFIAFMPLATLFIPFVRLILIANLDILLVGMVMMPLILVVVVFVLPDHSYIPRKPFSWDMFKADKSSERSDN